MIVAGWRGEAGGLPRFDRTGRFPLWIGWQIGGRTARFHDPGRGRNYTPVPELRSEGRSRASQAVLPGPLYTLEGIPRGHAKQTRGPGTKRPSLAAANQTNDHGKKAGRRRSRPPWQVPWGTCPARGSRKMRATPPRQLQRPNHPPHATRQRPETRGRRAAARKGPQTRQRRPRPSGPAARLWAPDEPRPRSHKQARSKARARLRDSAHGGGERADQAARARAKARPQTRRSRTAPPTQPEQSPAPRKSLLRTPAPGWLRGEN